MHRTCPRGRRRRRWRRRRRRRKNSPAGSTPPSHHAQGWNIPFGHTPHFDKFIRLVLAGNPGSEISLNNCNKSSITEKHKIHFSALAVEPRPWHYRLASEGHREGGEKSPLIFRRTKVAGRYPSSHLGPPPGVWKAPPSNFCGLEHGPSSLEGWLPASMVAVHPPEVKNVDFWKMLGMGWPGRQNVPTSLETIFKLSRGP